MTVPGVKCLCQEEGLITGDSAQCTLHSADTRRTQKMAQQTRSATLLIYSFTYSQQLHLRKCAYLAIVALGRGAVVGHQFDDRC